MEVYEEAVAASTERYEAHCNDVVTNYPANAPALLEKIDLEKVMEICLEYRGTLEDWIASDVGHLKP